MLKLKSQRGHVPRKLPSDEAGSQFMSASVCPTVAAVLLTCAYVCVCVGVCFMCLVNIYAAVNDEARKRCAKQVPTTTAAATTNW